MFGRGTQGNPWLFREIRAFLTGGIELPGPEPREVVETMLLHLDGMEDLYGAEQGARVFRKHVKWYLSRFSYGRALITPLLGAKDTSNQRDLLSRFLAFALAA